MSNPIPASWRALSLDALAHRVYTLAHDRNRLSDHDAADAFNRAWRAGDDAHLIGVLATIVQLRGLWGCDR